MDNNLKHHGILGMRWGVRRTKAQLRRARGPDKPRKVTKEQYEAAKKKAIESGDVDTIKKWKGHLTNDELRKAIDRVDLNRKLNGEDKSALKSGFEKVENVMDYVGRTVSIVDTGVKAYGLVAKINNTFNSNKLPEIDGIDAATKAAEKAEKAEKKRRENEKYEYESRKYKQAKEDDAKKSTLERVAEHSPRRSEEGIAAQKTMIKRLLKEGKTNVLTNNYKSFDQDVIDAVLRELEREQRGS